MSRLPSARSLSVALLSCLLTTVFLVSTPTIALALGSNELSDLGVPQEVLDVFPALVRIHVVIETPSGGRIEKQRGAGSGVIISSEGHVVTNHHVAGNASHIVCNLSDHQEVPAQLVGTDPLADIAVLKLDLSKLTSPGEALPTARWGDSDRLRVGDSVYAMGSPAAISQSVTKGIVANRCMIMPEGMGDGMELDGENVGSIVRWIAHDAVIFGGNSGGPLVNSSGEVIGINEIGFANLSGAIPGNLARSVATLLVQHGEVPRAWTGMTLQARFRDAAQGALVANVVKDSPAARSGIKVGDLLLEIGGVETHCRIQEDVPVVTSQLLRLPTEESLKMRYVRGGGEHRATIELERREPAQHKVREEPRLGITYRDVSRSMARRMGLGESRGVRIEGVRPGGAAFGGIPPLSASDVVIAVNGEPTSNSDRFVEQLGSAPSASLVLTVRRGAEQILSVVELGAATKRRPAGEPQRAWLPIKTQAITAEVAEAMGYGEHQGMRVTRVLGAGNGDLRIGDVLTALDGKKISARRASDTSAFRRSIERRTPGEEVTLTVLRDGETLQVVTALGWAPTPPRLMPTYSDSQLELECRDPAAADKEDSVSGNSKGVVVTEVARGGWADLAGLREGDRILRFSGSSVSSVADFSRLSEQVQANQPKDIVVLVARDHNTKFLRIEPVWESK